MALSRRIYNKAYMTTYSFMKKLILSLCLSTAMIGCANTPKTPSSNLDAANIVPMASKPLDESHGSHQAA